MATQLQDVPDAIETPDGGDTQAGERDFTAEATQRGWMPREEFKGDPAKWTDAETFVKREDERMPLLRKKVERQDRELADLKKQIRQASVHFSKAEERAYERARTELEGRLEQAISTGDVEAGKKVLKDIDALKKDVSDAAPSAEDAREAFDEWREGNSWYDKANLASASEIEVSARLYADRMTEKHLDKTKDMPPAEFFAYIGGLVDEKFPQLKTKPARQKPVSDVAGVGARGAGKNGKSFADLPAEAQAKCDKWFKSGIIPGKTQDEARAYYVKNYDWS
jgi:hypothetical protein